MKANFKSIIMLVILIGAVLVAVSIFTPTQEENFVYSEVIEMFDNDLVTSFVVDDTGTRHLKVLSY